MSRGVDVQGERAHRHPAFALSYAVLARAAERTSMPRLRRETLAPARGVTLVLGAGQGHELTHLPTAVTAVVAVEPDPVMRRLGQHRVRSASVPSWYVGARAEQLPLPDASVDTAVSSLVLCSVQDLDAAARELRRVLRSDGVLVLLEHVHAEEGSRLGRVQERVDPLWRHLSGGCHLHHRTRDALERAGFDTSGVRDRHLARLLPLIDPALQGVARPR